MSYQIDDYSKTKIFITDGWREWYLPKFRINMEVAEPLLTINWDDAELGSPARRQLVLDYQDVSGYGYANPTSAADLKAIIEAYEISAWTDIGPGGDLLTAKAQLLSHDGIGDAILAPGANEYWLRRNDSTLTGLDWVGSADIASAIRSITNVYYLPRFGKSAADQATTAIVQTDITGVNISISANENIYIKAIIKVGASANNGARYAVTIPTGATMFLSHSGTSAATVALAAPQWLTVSGTEGATTNAIINTNMWVLIEGWVYNGANAGTIQVQGRTANAANTVTFYSGSMIIGHIIP